jgi:hypothetical protein
VNATLTRPTPDHCDEWCWCQPTRPVWSHPPLTTAHYPAGWPLPRFDRPLGEQPIPEETHR